MKETHELTDELCLTEKYALAVPILGIIVFGCCTHGHVEKEE